MKICNFLLAVARKGFVRKSFSHKEANCFAPASFVVYEEREARRSVTQHNIVKEYHTLCIPANHVKGSEKRVKKSRRSFD